MMKFLLLFLTGTLFFPGDALEEARQGERERIARRIPLSADERDAWNAASRLSDKSRSSVESLSVDVQPFGFSDLPWKGDDTLTDSLDGVKRYFRALSRNRFSVRFRILSPILLGTSRMETARWPMGGKREEEMVSRLAGSPDEDHPPLLLVAAGKPADRESVLWPHGGDRKKNRYVLIPGDLHGWEVGALAHELMHLYDLPDKYDLEKGAAGEWCLMGTGYRSRGKDGLPAPGPLCAVCRDRMGWVTMRETKPAADEAKIVLDPVEEGGEALRVVLNRDGSDALVLEGRREKGLLIWHVREGHVPRFLGCYPSETTDRLTAWSEPSFRSDASGSGPVCITDIRQEEGKSWLVLSRETAWTPLERIRRSSSKKELGK